MGKVYSLLARPIRTFNIENRAQRIISREKPIPAPHHPSVQKQMKIVEQMNPDFIKNHSTKNPQLHEHLKNVYVSSIDPKGQQQKQQIISTKQLPQKQSHLLSDNNIGNADFDKPCQHIRNKCSFEEVIEFINMYQENPTENTIDVISKQYRLDKQVIQNIVTNFKIFTSVDIQQKKLDWDKKNEKL